MTLPRGRSTRKVAAGPKIILREAEEQALGVAFLRRIGFKVGVTSQRRASSVTAGLPDVIAVGRGITLFWEAKAAGGVLSDDQKAWGAACKESNIPWVHGPMGALMAYLRELKVMP